MERLEFVRKEFGKHWYRIRENKLSIHSYTTHFVMIMDSPLFFTIILKLTLFISGISTSAFTSSPSSISASYPITSSIHVTSAENPSSSSTTPCRLLVGMDNPQYIPDDDIITNDPNAVGSLR